jgi:site-specific recombinase XerD
MLCEVLQTHCESSKWSAPDDFVFARADGAPYDGNWLRIRVLFPALESVGIQRQKSAHGFHLFRHSAASIAPAETRDLSLAQKLLGHSRLSTTADIYTHTHGKDERGFTQAE